MECIKAQPSFSGVVYNRRRYVAAVMKPRHRHDIRILAGKVVIAIKGGPLARRRRLIIVQDERERRKPQMLIERYLLIRIGGKSITGE